MFDEQSARVESKISQVNSLNYLSVQEKQNTINTLKQSIVFGTDSSQKVITSVANTMIGTAIIVYPVLFIKDGIIGSTLIMLLVGCVQYLTCRLLVVHNRNSQMSYSQTIKRICGQRVYKFNASVNVLVLFFVCSAYFLLVVQNFYQVSSAFIQGITQFQPPSSNQICFSKYSLQYATIVCVCFIGPLLFSKSIDGLFKFFKYTVYCVLAYGIFVFAAAMRQIVQGNIHFSQYRFFDSDFSSVAGAFALSFLIHPTAATILKKNVKQQNNKRDLFLGYCLTAFIYFYVGFIGGLSCATSVQDINNNPQMYNTIFDCVSKKNTTEQQIFYVAGKIIQFGILVQNISVFPILNFLARKQFIDLINKPHLDKILFNAFTTTLVLFSSFIAIFCIKVDLVLSVDGAIVGFFMGYGVPIYMHLVCLYKKLSPQQKRLRASLLTSQSSEVQEAQKYGMTIDSQIMDQNEVQSIVRCNPHPKSNKIFDYSLYGGLIVIGIALGTLKLVAFFK